MPGRWKKQRDFHAKSLPRELKNKMNLERYGPIFIHSAPAQMQPSRTQRSAPINRKAPARRTGAFHRMSAPPRKRMEHGHSDPFSSRKLEREPGGERLHAVTL